MSKENLKPATVSSKMFPKLPSEKPTFAFAKDNYKMMLIGIAVITIGMLFMMGGGSDDPKKFSEALFDFQRITLAPILIIAGYIIVLLAILKKPKEQSTGE